MMGAARRSMGIRETTVRQNTGVKVTDTNRGVESRDGMASERGTVPGSGSGGGTETVMTVLEMEEKTL